MVVDRIPIIQTANLVINMSAAVVLPMLILTREMRDRERYKQIVNEPHLWMIMKSKLKMIPSHLYRWLEDFVARVE